MTREEWCSLPPALALAVLYDALPEGTRQAIEDAPAPRLPRAPKFDTAIFRSGGVTYASEYDAEGLRYWRERAAQSSDPKYADSDAKKVKALDYWIEYRAYYPNAPWTGERNRVVVTAAPPCAKPTIHPREARNGSAGAASSSGKSAPSFDDDTLRGGAADDDIPFAKWDPPC